MSTGREEDFSAYDAARWPTLVRSAVFLGCGIDETHDLHAKVRVDRCPALASCGTGVSGTEPAAGRVVAAGGTVAVVVVRRAR